MRHMRGKVLHCTFLYTEEAETPPSADGDTTSSNIPVRGDLLIYHDASVRTTRKLHQLAAY